ncbi:MAG: TIGR03032 family protein [Gemmataceae bacterium]|nr:TIGR03032 family protein [Gemmataceae bacterium]MDW8267049.1 DUF4915 domain-containing protein [Gemmataceae bacterium]
MARLLVSICNKHRAGQTAYPGVFLAEIDTERDEARPVMLKHPDLGPAKGITGLAHFRDGILAVLQGLSQLAHFTANYSVRDVWTIPLLKHAHSIAVSHDKAYIASTGNDSIVEFDPPTSARVFWQANSGHTDTIHLNSVAWRDGELYATAFGAKRNGLWNMADGGYLTHLATGTRLVSSLFHPHSLCTSGGDFYFCESSRQAIGREDGTRLVVGSGYTRGLVVTPDHLYVGISKGRAHSESTGVPVQETAVPRATAATSGVFTYQRQGPSLADSQRRRFISLEGFGDEIYDILLLED